MYYPYKVVHMIVQSHILLGPIFLYRGKLWDLAKKDLDWLIA